MTCRTGGCGADFSQVLHALRWQRDYDSALKRTGWKKAIPFPRADPNEPEESGGSRDVYCHRDFAFVVKVQRKGTPWPHQSQTEARLYKTFQNVPAVADLLAKILWFGRRGGHWITIMEKLDGSDEDDVFASELSRLLVYAIGVNEIQLRKVGSAWKAFDYGF